MNIIENQLLIHQAEYAKKLRPLLPSEAFMPDRSKVVILLINLTILLLGWGIASHLDRWPIALLWLYLPVTLIMGNSVIALLFSSHDLMHTGIIKNPYWLRIVSLLGLTMLWMPPTLWKNVHNRVHHLQTNALGDPDRNFLYQQPNTWGKWIQNLFVPSQTIHPFWLLLGLMNSWGIYVFRNLTSVLLFNSEDVNYVPAAFKVRPEERREIAVEFLIIFMLHISILAYLQFNLLKLALSYFLPIAIGYAGIIFYVYTNHMLSPMTSINDPLANSISIKVPKLFDLLHLNFSYHAEHHIFPGMNSDYYPIVQNLIKIHYPERSHYILGAREAWWLLLNTPRHYKNETTLTDWTGEASVPCRLNESCAILKKDLR
ncbi:MAG: fatty acid desaturase [Gloeobacterales cyanobacterium]